MENNIILINQNGTFINRTKEIKSWNFKGNGYCIRFAVNNKFYNYSVSNAFVGTVIRTVEFSNYEIIICNDKTYTPKKLFYLQDSFTGNRKILLLEENKEVIINNTEISILAVKEKLDSNEKIVVRRKDGFVYNNVSSIFIYEGYYRIFFSNETSRVYSTSNLEISKLLKSAGSFDYFKEIANILSSPNDEISQFLSRQYENMDIDSNSIFYNFLKNPYVKTVPFNCSSIFPFNFNASQMEATKKALENNVSIIEGPPGTGKTETILNILMNLIVQEKSVAVVSGNNFAVENIKTKLTEYNLDFLTALLGNKDNRSSFFENKHSIPDLSCYSLSTEEKVHLEYEIEEDLTQIKELLELNNKLANVKIELSNLQNEQLYFVDSFETSKVQPLSFSNLTLDQLSNLIVETYTIPITKKISFFNKLKLFFKYGFVYFKNLEQNPSQVQLNLKRYLYVKKILELKAEILKHTKQLSSRSFEKLNDNIKDKSMKLLKSYLYNRFSTCSKREFTNTFGEENYYINNFNDFLKRYPIILSTVHSLKNCSAKNFLYDYVIIDEASQTDLVAAGVALSCAKNIIVVGDLKQLSHIVPESIKNKVSNLSKSYKISPSYDYVENNILSCFKSLYNTIQPTLLKEHYRCHPKIIGFCNKFFYNNELIIHTSGDSTDAPLILIESSKGNHSREDEQNKLFNLREVEECLRYYPEINKENFSPNNIGFISPFNAQIALSEAHLQKEIFKSTINKFQGQEGKVIIFSTVLDGGSRTSKKRLNFVNNSNLINVAVSRAKNRFVLISNSTAFKPGSTVAELTNYIKYNSLSDSIIKSDVYSIFDLMYSNYSDKLLNICIENIKKVSNYPSENLANYVIDTVLAMPKYHFLSSIFSVSLDKLIKNPYLLTEAEKQFVFETSSEVDFVIYNKNSHAPILLIEVDGFAFHHKKKDVNRDKMKNCILEKYKIRYLRWPTNSSGEQEKLIKTLDEIIDSQDKIKIVENQEE